MSSKWQKRSSVEEDQDLLEDIGDFVERHQHDLTEILTKNNMFEDIAKGDSFSLDQDRVLEKDQEREKELSYEELLENLIASASPDELVQKLSITNEIPEDYSSVQTIGGKRKRDSSFEKMSKVKKVTEVCSTEKRREEINLESCSTDSDKQRISRKNQILQNELVQNPVKILSYDQTVNVGGTSSSLSETGLDKLEEVISMKVKRILEPLEVVSKRKVLQVEGMEVVLEFEGVEEEVVQIGCLKAVIEVKKGWKEGRRNKPDEEVEGHLQRVTKAKRGSLRWCRKMENELVRKEDVEEMGEEVEEIKEDRVPSCPGLLSQCVERSLGGGRQKKGKISPTLLAKLMKTSREREPEPELSCANEERLRPIPDDNSEHYLKEPAETDLDKRNFGDEEEFDSSQESGDEEPVPEPRPESENTSPPLDMPVFNW